MSGEMEAGSHTRLLGSTPLMTASDLAAYLAISKSMVYKLVEEGKIPYVKIGKSVRFRQEAIEEWLKSQSVESQIAGADNADFEREVDKLLRSTTIKGRL